MQNTTSNASPVAQQSMPVNHDSQGQHDSETGSSSKQQKSRHRASVACSSCRERRIRCVVPAGEIECAQCKRAGTECIIKNDDERRRPISRAYMSALTDRVAMLETMLKESGKTPPPVHYPPKTTRGSLYADGDDSPVRPPQLQNSFVTKTDTSNLEEPRERTREGSHVGPYATAEDRSDNCSIIGTRMTGKKDGLVSRLLSTRGHLSFDQPSGRLRYYGGTVNCHVYSELEVDKSKDENDEQARRADKCIRTLSIDTHAYLMELFWQHYNSVLHVVHQDAFNEDHDRRQTQFYSGFLHVCILAMGFRFADKSRPDIQRIAMPNRESTLHREAKYMLDLELERPGGIPSIAALLILGDSEVGVGREQVGWMYAGMAMRLCYDLGLQLDSRNASLPAREVEIRRLTLWACVIYDRYWSLFLGRPLTMKPVDVEIYSLTDQFERLGTCMPAGSANSLHTKIYSALIELMEVAGKIVEQAEFRQNNDDPQSPDQSAYIKMASLDRDLHNWASRLPADLKYNEENRQNAPFSFYLLHQQYHAILILLHRPFARYDDTTNGESEESTALDSHFSRASRAICTKSAVAMSRIFWQHRQRFDGKQIFCVGMQHAGAAATALIAALAHMPDAAERNNNMQYLEVLHAALQDMTHAYEPAERMAAVLNAVIVELRGGPISPTHATIPARRGSVSLEEERGLLKRRQTSRSDLSHAMPPPPMPPRPPPAPEVGRAHLNSETASNHSIQPYQPQPTEYTMVASTAEPNAWPIQHNHDLANQSMIPMAQAPPIPAAEAQTTWVQPQVAPHYFSQMPQMEVAGLPAPSCAGLDFSHGIPSGEDWTRWHAANGMAAPADPNGYPPREQYPGPYDPPPMNGMMNG